MGGCAGGVATPCPGDCGAGGVFTGGATGATAGASGATGAGGTAEVPAWGITDGLLVGAVGAGGVDAVTTGVTCTTAEPPAVG